MDFVLGVIVGVCGLFIIALHFSNKAAESQSQPATVTPSALGLDMSGRGGLTIETSIPSDALRRVFKQLENGIS